MLVIMCFVCGDIICGDDFVFYFMLQLIVVVDVEYGLVFVGEVLNWYVIWCQFVVSDIEVWVVVILVCCQWVEVQYFVDLGRYVEVSGLCRQVVVIEGCLVDLFWCDVVQFVFLQWRVV